MTETNWRDISTELTAEQITRLESAAHMSDADLTDIARNFARRNQTQAAHAHIPVPAGAVKAGDWFDDGERVSRAVYGTERLVADTVIDIAGEQDVDGTTSYRILVQAREASEGALTAVEARAAAAALLAAADELDRLNGVTPPFA